MGGGQKQRLRTAESGGERVNELKRAWDAAVKGATQRAWEYGVLVEVDGVVAVRGRVDYVWVKIANQTITYARNEAGLPHTAGLAVRMLKDYGTYVIYGRSNNSELAAPIATPPSGVAAHAFTNHTDVPSNYMGASGRVVAVNVGEDGLEFVAGGGGAVDSVNGQTGVVILGSDDIAEGVTNLYTTPTTVGSVINAATAKTTPVDADTLPLTDSAASNVLKKLSWANVKATLKTYFDTLYNLYVHPNHTGDVTSVADGATTIGAAKVLTAMIADDAVANAKLANMAQNTVRGRITASTGDPEDLTAANVRTIINVASGADVTGTAITALATKTTPVDADAVVITDSAASDAPKRTLWSNIKATLKTYFDALYEAVGAVATHAALTVTHGVTGAVVGTTTVQSLSNKVVNDSTFGAGNTFEVGEHGGLGDADNLFVASNVDNLIRRSSWANIKSTLKTYFDPLYIPTAASWTPGIAFGGASVGVTYGTVVARYVKNGAHCTVWGRMSLTNKGTSVGGATITGLPFTSANITGILFTSTARADITYNGTLSIYINPNGSTIGVEQLVGATITQLTNTAFTNTSTIQFQITYQVP